MGVVTFPNGVKLQVEEMSELNTATVCVDLLGGVQSEPQLYNGMCEMIARLLLCGTKKYPTRAELLEHAKAFGLKVSVEAKTEFLQIKINCLSNRVNWAIDFAHDILFESKFDQSVIDMLKVQMKAEAKMARLNPTTMLNIISNQTLFARTGLTNINQGNVRSIERITKEMLLAQLERFLCPKNIVIAVGGEVDSDKITEKVGELFYTNLEDPKYRQIKLVSHVENSDGYINIKKRKLNQARAMISFPSYSFKDNESFAIKIVGSLACERIKQALADEKYFKSLSEATYCFANNGKFSLNIAVDDDNAQEFIEKVLEELKNIKENSVITKTSFNAEKQSFITNFVLLNEQEDNLVEACAKELLIKKKPYNLNERYEVLSGLTYEDAMKSFKKIIDFSKINIAFLGSGINFGFLEKFVG
ncbi:MAG: insulinase family protein [Clostridia bacterium]|nr:insulinase family protein [Clostridia bacterium]